MIKKYVKKPIEVEAVQWTGDNTKEIQEFIEYDDEKTVPIIIKWKWCGSIGDFIIKDESSRIHCCKPDVFKKTYEEIK